MSAEEKTELLDRFYETNAKRPLKVDFEEDRFGMLRLPKSLHRAGKKPGNPRHNKTTNTKGSSDSKSKPKTPRKQSGKSVFKQKKNRKERNSDDYNVEYTEDESDNESFKNPYSEEGKFQSIYTRVHLHISF